MQLLHFSKFNTNHDQLKSKPAVYISVQMIKNSYACWANTVRVL